MTNAYKKCTHCNQNKKLEHFGKLSRTKDGLQYHCKACVNKKEKDYVKRNPEKKKLPIKSTEIDQKLKRKDWNISEKINTNSGSTTETQKIET